MSISSSTLRKLAMLDLSSEQMAGVLVILADAAEKDEARKTAQRERTRKHREQRYGNVTVTQMQRDTPPKKETSPTPPKEKTTPLSSGDKSPSRCERDFFAEFWLSYPHREGPNPKKPARLSFDRLVAKGTDPQAIISAAQALAVEHPTPTRFVPQAVTWLNQERFADHAPVITGDTFCPSDDPATRLHVIRYRNEHDGHDPPAGVQGGKSGHLIPTEWVKSMQLRMANG